MAAAELALMQLRMFFFETSPLERQSPGRGVRQAVVHEVGPMVAAHAMPQGKHEAGRG